MKKIITTAVLTAAALGLGLNAPAEAATHHHVKRAACAQSWQHPGSAIARQCRKQGWTIDVDYDAIDGIWDVLVVGPKGRVYQDTFGQLGNVR